MKYYIIVKFNEKTEKREIIHYKHKTNVWRRDVNII